jgi:hypothetical protein
MHHVLISNVKYFERGFILRKSDAFTVQTGVNEHLPKSHDHSGGNILRRRKQFS